MRSATAEINSIQYKCEIYGDVFKETKLYGPKRYYASCLNKRHSQEAADEVAGKTVKRYEMKQESADGIDHAANICRATAEANSALDDVLAYLKQRSAYSAYNQG